MTLSIREDDAAALSEYARVSIAFDVAEAFDVAAIDALRRGERPAASRLRRSYRKDYDSIEGNRPTDWPSTFDVSRWILLAARWDDERVGGAVVIHADPQITLLRDCPDCALLWDLRVALTMRGRGIGTALLESVEAIAAGRGATALRVETQQINVPACRFYARHGFTLERVTPDAYPRQPGETQLLWRKPL